MMTDNNVILRYSTFFLILILFIISNSGLSQDWRGKGRVNGVVLTEDGKPIPNVRIQFQHTGYEGTFEVTSDEKGKWVAANIRGGGWNIDFTVEGYEPKKISTRVSEVIRSKPIEVILKKTEKSVVSEKVSKLLAKGNELFSQQKYAEAIQEYQHILRENPQIYIINKNIGNCYYQLEDYDSAIKYYELVLLKDPGSEEMLIALGNVYLEKGELEKGLEYFNQIDETSITNPLVLYNIGTSFFNKGEIERAINYYSRASELDLNLSDAYFQLGLCYVNKNEKDKAVEYFQKFLEISPDSERAVTARNLLEFLKKDLP
jgi:tetratricopeptide (TPR) repeat protein